MITSSISGINLAIPVAIEEVITVILEWKVSFKARIAGVSEKKREYLREYWIETAKKMIDEHNYQVLFTGSFSEKILTDELALQTGIGSFSLGGALKLDEFISLVQQAPAIVSVNTGSIHIAAAVQTPVVVLYAQTNPQHTPWNVAYRILEYEVPVELRSKNEVIQYMYKTVYAEKVKVPLPQDIITAVFDLLQDKMLPAI